ncbi:MAG: hypothetical protein HGA42_00555 [Nostocales cyanobacterium W4_Combined_metabat2_030]|nr:hypothetical protein [Nostocales cyanobacterium W4_Combined_metabat2_030]
MAITIPQAQQINRVYNANELLESDNDALIKHVAALDSIIDQKDTLLLYNAKNVEQWANISDSLFNANIKVNEQLHKSKKRTTQAFYIGTALGAGIIILTAFLVR